MKHANVAANNADEYPLSVDKDEAMDTGTIIIERKAPEKAIPAEAKYAHLLKDIKPHPRKIKKVAINNTIVKTIEFSIFDNNEKK